MVVIGLNGKPTEINVIKIREFKNFKKYNMVIILQEDKNKMHNTNTTT